MHANPHNDRIISHQAGSFPYIYDELLEQLLNSPHEELNQRTGARIKMLGGGCSFKIDLTDQRVPITGSRKLWPHVAAAEIAWFLQGSQDVAWLNQYAKIWDKFTEPGPNGEKTNHVDAAYGHRWRFKFGRDQIALAIEALRKNPTDRRIWVQAWDPTEDGLGAQGQRNVPCPVGFTFSIIDGLLHSSLFIRSSDVFVGLPYDTMGHAILMANVAASLGLMGLGTLQVTLSHPHLYEAHYDMAAQCLVNVHHPKGPELYAWRVEDVLRDPDGFVFTYRKSAQAVTWPEYAPKPELIL